LDPGQYKAVVELAGNGDFLSVLTAPAGAGKTGHWGLFLLEVGAGQSAADEEHA